MNGTGSSRLERGADVFARVALGAAFLSAVASRLGLWPHGGGWAAFVAYTAEVNSFLPAAAAPALALAATIAESALGIALFAGWRIREASFASAALLAVFGTAMAISFGPKSPLDYSVFSASAGALLLGIRRGLPVQRPS